MAETSEISWCDSTFNPWMGCTKVSPACKNCYAERDMDFRLGKVAWGPSGTRVLTSDDNWKKPLKWNRQAGEGKRPRVFCASLADVFEDWQGPIHNHKGEPLYRTSDGFTTEKLRQNGERRHALSMNDVRARLFKLIDATPNLDWLVLTKRPENIQAMTPCNPNMNDQDKRLAWYRENLWLGTSVENQEYADKRIPDLLQCKDMARFLFLSCEPLVGPIDLEYPESLFPNGPQMCCSGFECGCRGLPCDPPAYLYEGVDWIITGGESGPEARPNHPNWFRSLRDQAERNHIPFHFKQWGEWAPGTVADTSPHAAVLINGKYCTPDSRDARISLDREVDGQWDHLQPTVMARVGKVRAGRMLDGVVHDAFPER